MANNLVIVESPAKAKTITKYLGSDYRVLSSYGHIRDLPKKGIGVDIDKNFEPTYEVPADKSKVVNELKKAAKNVTVWLASDEDREGEAIAWHTCMLLGLDPEKVNRIVFHEITEAAIKEAVKNPRHINQKLVDAQQARRVLDRLVGYELSPVLWKKVRTGLSAGRVQSVAVRLIVEKEREIKNTEKKTYYKIAGDFKAGSHELVAELNKKYPTKEDASGFFNSIIKSDFTVSDITKKPATRTPSAPFTTSTLQQAASQKLGFSVRQTMTLAQRLYENGHITYMRTDSVNLATVALDATEKYIKTTFGDKYFAQRTYKTKSRGAQEAHEAIRPTNFNVQDAGDDSAQKKLYRLIWSRALASQMAPAQIEKSEIIINITDREEKFIASGEILVFDGFIKVYGGGKDDKILPNLSTGDKLDLIKAVGTENFERGPARYSEASLVKKLEELGIGRPSTYAPTIGTIQDRGYVVKSDLEGELKNLTEVILENTQVREETKEVTVGADRSKLLPTELAEIVNDFLVKNFSEIVDYDFTARAEEEFDEIALGKIKWQQMLSEFYKKLHPLIKSSESISRSEAVKARELGKDPKTNEPIIVRFARFGAVLQLGESPDPKDKGAPKPKFAPLPKGETIESITLEKALPMFDLPRVVGKTAEGEEITANIGPYGPYIKIGKSFISIKEDDPLTISEDRAREIAKEHHETKQKREIAVFGKIKILNGPYGPYITDGKKNARISKDMKPEEITEQEAKKILDEAPIKKWRGRKRK